MKKVLLGVGIAILAALLFCVIYFAAVPSGRETWHRWTHSLSKADETSYETRKKVEDTCRAMISSYKSDKLIYEQYRDSEVLEERSWANSAKIRANQTANTYNEYILKNSYIWQDNVPSDIYLRLEILE